MTNNSATRQARFVVGVPRRTLKASTTDDSYFIYYYKNIDEFILFKLLKKYGRYRGSIVHLCPIKQECYRVPEMGHFTNSFPAW